MKSVVDQIKEKLDIVDVISGYIKLQKTGANYRALCPFHQEKTPSFFVSPARQIWHCFGCGAGGDIFTFVMKIEGVEFGDALRILAKKAGVELKRENPKLRTERQRIYEICELSSKFFEKQLWQSKAGNLTKEYLLKRGINQESIRKWRLGYSPDQWQGLSDFLVNRGYKREEVEKAGLSIRKESGGWYDRFRGRIMFPIFDTNSQVIGFGGRITESQKSDAAKYVNTSNTLLYDKSSVLYGLNFAKMEIRKRDVSILMEGYTDVILSHQAGFSNTVSVSGTALTPQQLNILKRYSKNLITAFDMDFAGNSATKKGIALAQKDGFNVRIVLMPEGKDPADVISQEGAAEWKKLIEAAKPILEFYFALAFKGKNSESVEEKKKESELLLPVIKRIPNKIEQAYWVGELARRLGVREESVEEELKKTKSSRDVDNAPVSDRSLSQNESKEPLSKKTRNQLLEEKILSLIFGFPEKIKFSNLDKEVIKTFSSPAKEILLKLKKKGTADAEWILKEYKNSSETLDFLNYVLLKSELEKEQESEPLKEFEDCLVQFHNFGIKKRLDELSLEIRKAEGDKNYKKLEKLTQEFNELSKKLYPLK